MLTTLSSVKSYLGITSITNDALINSLIASVSAFIVSYAGRQLEAATYTEILSGGKKNLFLRNYPVNSVTSVRENIGTQGTPSMSTVSVDDYTIFYEAGFLEHRSYFSRGSRNIEVVYNAGYSVIPKDLDFVAVQLVGKAFASRKSQGKKMEMLGSARIEWANELTEEQKSILDNYVKPVC